MRDTFQSSIFIFGYALLEEFCVVAPQLCSVITSERYVYKFLPHAPISFSLTLTQVWRLPASNVRGETVGAPAVRPLIVLDLRKKPFRGEPKQILDMHF